MGRAKLTDEELAARKAARESETSAETFARRMTSVVNRMAPLVDSAVSACTYQCTETQADFVRQLTAGWVAQIEKALAASLAGKTVKQRKEVTVPTK